MAVRDGFIRKRKFQLHAPPPEKQFFFNSLSPPRRRGKKGALRDIVNLEYHIRKNFRLNISYFNWTHSLWRGVFCEIGRDGVAASKNWKTKSSLSTGVERVYTKKNRHSESVPRCPGYKQLTMIRSAKALGGGKKFFFGKNLIIIFSSQEETLEKKRCNFFWIFFVWKKGEKAYSTQCSQVVAHLSTNWAWPGLTSEIGRVQVYSR